MRNMLIACFLFLMVPSFAQPFSMRNNVDHGNKLSANVSMGIVIALCMTLPLIVLHCADILVVVLFIIPLLWCAYRVGTRSRQNPRPLFTMPPPTFPVTSNHSSIPPSGQMISPPRPAHKKVANPTYRA